MYCTAFRSRSIAAQYFLKYSLADGKLQYRCVNPSDPHITDQTDLVAVACHMLALGAVTPSPEFVSSYPSR
jgi:putative hemolysin